jgi:hypothetical protein
VASLADLVAPGGIVLVATDVASVMEGAEEAFRENSAFSAYPQDSGRPSSLGLVTLYQWR